MSALVIALGFAVLFNFIILRIKFNKGLYADVGVDILLLVILNSVFGGSILGVISATAGSTLISLYLIWKPITFFDTTSSGDIEDTTEPTGKSKAAKSMASRFDKLFE